MIDLVPLLLVFKSLIFQEDGGPRPESVIDHQGVRRDSGRSPGSTQVVAEFLTAAPPAS
jgi:hypothetical protein